MIAIPLIYAVTLNWNGRDQTLECIASLSRLTYPNVRLLVVDNASTDGSPQAIAARFPRAEQIVNPVNLGFGAGFNVGWRHALAHGADYVFTLNNDTTVAPDILEQLVNALEPPEVGIVAPVIFYAAAPERIWSTGAGRSPITLEITGDQGRYSPLPTQVVEREFLTACGLLIKRAVLEQTGFFDEQFFMYYEDSDYCIRARAAGWRLVVAPKAFMWHAVTTSSGGNDSPMYRYWMGRSSTQFYRKHIRGWRWLIMLPWRWGSMLKTTTRLLSEGRGASAWAYLRGIRDGMRHPAGGQVSARAGGARSDAESH